MASHHASTSYGGRPPLGEATDRINNVPSNQSYKSSQMQEPGLVRNPLRAHSTNNRLYNKASRAEPGNTASIVTPATMQQHEPGASRELQDEEDKRISQISTSTASSGKHKTHIGPWNLGKTLGRGSASRVRLARHHRTGQLAAVKILPRHNGLSQAGSLVELDKWDRRRGEFASEHHIPLAIEREVAMLKLIDHPNIVKLYLVLEHVKHGDLFSIINTNGAFTEDQAVYYFRQILSAVEYCHTFNICHRDLKPENILLNEYGEAKVADFGMACIQQSPGHKLRTSCGSPHYAAPELVSNKTYKGDKVDVWSLGVVLYAMITCMLPFDHHDTSVLLAMTRRGSFRVPAFVSPEAKDLLKRMIEVDPEKRISTRKIWHHPLLRKYEHLDKLNSNGGQPPEIDKSRRYDQVLPEDLDMQLLRQLKSLWHTYSEKFLAMKLTSSEPNDQKLFYWLLYKYREKRLENYDADLTYSASDFHHLRPANWKKKFTTMEFPPAFGRTPSRFTVISTIATDADGEALETGTDAGMTIQSYDPYKSSLNLDMDTTASHARITVHRNSSLARTSTRASNRVSRLNGSMKSTSTNSRGGSRRITPSGLGTSKRSLSSIRSGESVPYTRMVSRHKRGVDFSQARKRSIDQSRDDGHRAPASIAGDDTTIDRDHMAPSSPAKRARISRNSGRSRAGAQTMTNMQQFGAETPAWMDELRHLSDSIAKDCDDAFNSTLLSPGSAVGETTLERSANFSMGPGMSPVATSTPQGLQGPRAGQDHLHPWDTRPLPRAPPRSESVLREIERIKDQAESGRGNTDISPGHTDRVLTHLDRLAKPSPQSADSERRTASAPIYTQYSTKWGQDAVPMPSTYEGAKQGDKYDRRDKQRVVSAPTESSVPRPTPFEECKGLEFLAQQENTIRMVTSPSRPTGSGDVPAPLRIRKTVPPRMAEDSQSQQELDLRQQYRRDELKEPIVEESSTLSQETSSAADPVKKKPSWFKRNSKDKEGVANSRGNSVSTNTDFLTYTDTTSTAEHTLATKKKSFNFAFWRNSKEQQPRMELSLGPDYEDSRNSPEPVRMFSQSSRRTQNQKWNDQTTTRNIEPQRNWLARLFRVKPATGYLCFSISRRRTRQEIAILLREWRKYGIRDVEVDKQRNIIFARVGQNNFLGMKEVSFAIEIMTVIEHGKRNQLSIVRFTQERGAASSFHKVVDTMDAVFQARYLLVEDKRKAKMMIKTLNS